MAILTVSIEAFGEEGSLMRWLDQIFNVDAVRQGNRDYLDQLKSAIFVNGSLEEQRLASFGDWTMHLVSLPWKLLFAWVPPTSYFGGWLCFAACLLCIAGITGVIADLAELFGCVVSMDDFVTA